MLFQSKPCAISCAALTFGAYLLGDFGAHLVRVVCKALTFRFIKALLVAAIAKWSVFCETTCANKDGLVLGDYFNWTSCVEADNS